MQPFDPTGAYPQDEVLAALQGLDGTRELDFRFERLDSTNQAMGDLSTVVSASVSNNALADIKRTAKFVISDDEPMNYLSDRIKPWCRLTMPPKFAWLPSGAPRANLIPNPSMETDTTGWSATGTTLVTQATLPGTPDGGTKALAVTGNKTVSALARQNLVPNPSFETNTTGWTGVGGTLTRGAAPSPLTPNAAILTSTAPAAFATRTNLVPNPSFEVNTTGWVVSSGCTIARSTAQFYVGGACLALTATSTSMFVNTTPNGVGALPVVPGVSYVIQARMRSATISRSLAVGYQWYDSAGVAIGSWTVSGGTASSTSTWTLTSTTQTSPAGAAYLRVTVGCSTVVAGEVHYFDAVMVEQASSVGSYFDGSTTLAGVTNSWTGTAHQSPSTQVNTPADMSLWQSTYMTWPGSAPFAISAYVRAATVARLCYVRVDWFDSIGTFLSSSTGTATTNSTSAWTRVSVQGTSPATAALGYTYLYTQGTSGSEVHYWDQVLAETSSALGTYFDGSSAAGGGYTYSWAGTAHASPSNANVLVGQNETGVNIVWPTVAVTAGQLYTFSAYLRASATPMTAYLNLQWFAGATPLYSNVWAHCPTATAAEWTRIMTTRRVPATATSVKITVQLGLLVYGETVYLDAAMAEQGVSGPIRWVSDGFDSSFLWGWYGTPPVGGDPIIAALAAGTMNFYAYPNSPLSVSKTETGFDVGAQYTYTATLAAWTAGLGDNTVIGVEGIGSTAPVNLPSRTLNTPTRLSYTFTATAPTHTFTITSAGATNTDVVVYDAQVFDDTPEPLYFDGDSTDLADLTYSWSGTPRASVSLAQPFAYVEDTSWRGYVEWPLGVFLLTSPKRSMAPGDQITRDVEAYDQALVLTDNVVSDRYEVAAGVVYTTAVAALLTGIPVRNITPTTKTLPVAMSWEPGTAYLRIINDLLAAVNYESAWFDENGVFIARPYQSPETRAPEYTYATDETSVISGQVDQTLDLYGVANKWVLVVSDPDRAAIVGTYTNTSASSPTSTVNRGRTIVDFRTEQDAADSASLTAKAARLAFEASQVYEEIEFSTAIMPIHSNADVYGIVVDEMGVGAKYSEHTWEMPLQAGALMKHSARRIINLGA